MKKQLLLLISMLLPMVAMADDSGSCGTNVTYTYESSTNTLTIQGSGTMTDYSYDDDVPWYSYRKDIKTVVIKDGVTSIGDYAFYKGYGLTSIEIPNSVTSIRYGAFYNCSGLTSIEIPNSVTSIGESAFEGCSGLTSIEIPNSVTSIGSGAFRGCTGLTSIEIPNSVTSIGDYAFDETPWYNNQPNGLVYAGKVAYKYKGTMPDNTSITIKEGTLGIAVGAFEYCRSLTSIEIPNSVTSIGSGAFRGCTGLTSIEIPNSVTSIGGSAFYNCIGLTSITIPNSVTSIGGFAFHGCSGLTSIVIPNSVTSIGGSTFYNCIGLTSIVIPNSVTSIGDLAFQGCSGLTSVTIGNSVTSIGDWAFSGCDCLTSISVEKGNSMYDSRNNCNAIIETSTNTLIAGCMNSIIPNSVTSIGDRAFSGCRSLTSIEIPNSVTSIGEYAFSSCSGLTSVTIKRMAPLFIKQYTFSNRANATLYVPNGSKGYYESISYWKEFKEIIEMPSPRCATPTISYKNGELTFDCETEGVKYVSTITAPESTEADGKKIDLSKSFRVSVYATKEGYTDSDIATQDINVRGIKGDVDGDGVVDVNDVQTTINIILKK